MKGIILTREELEAEAKRRNIEIWIVARESRCFIYLTTEELIGAANSGLAGSGMAMEFLASRCGNYKETMAILDKLNRFAGKHLYRIVAHAVNYASTVEEVKRIRREWRSRGYNSMIARKMCELATHDELKSFLLEVME